MRLYALRRFYGLHWKTSLPAIDWRLWIDALLFVLVICFALAMVEYISDNVKLADANAIAVHRADRAELNLAHCLNGGSLNADGGMVMCEKAYWVRTGNHG